MPAAHVRQRGLGDRRDRLRRLLARLLAWWHDALPLLPVAVGGLWRGDAKDFMPIGAAIAWWLIATVAFSGGYFTANLMHSAVSGQIPQRMRQFLIAVGVLLLIGAGQAATAPGGASISGVLAGIAALCLGAVMAFCGANFALRKN